jgi:hypothetical protein
MVAVGVGVLAVADGVSIVMTDGVEVGSAALLGGEVAAAAGLGVGVRWMTITRGVGVAVVSPLDVGDTCALSANRMERMTGRVGPS